MLTPVSFVGADPGPLTAAAIAAEPPDIDEALRFATTAPADAVVPGGGATRDLWEALASLAAADLGVARAVEPHWDAVAILRQAGRDAPAGAWGVFAAEGGPDPLLATPGADGWTLTGTKPWCSLAGVLDGALVTAADAGGTRRLFAADLRHPGVAVQSGAWAARGLVEVPSGPVRFDAVPADPVGADGWYLARPGFEYGAIGVAACWFGGAIGIGRSVHAAAATKPNPFLLAHLGRIDQLLEDGRRALAEAAERVDAAAPGARVLAKRVRATVAAACEEIIDRAGHALGPAPLAMDPAHAKRVADLQLYVRQHHAERDQESLGRALAEGAAPW
ncbi:acyl-CoA dehydrogenase [Pseudolysinimonas sp.]|uniref:acyl-CoA dehydrogenase n=1 Tax=Pseudolysinimonas sp. TaxID=2680009 RepID=UPI003F7ECDA0